MAAAAVAAVLSTVGLSPRASASAEGWSVVATPNVGTGVKNGLDGVSCAPDRATFCMAVGGYYTGTGPSVKHTEIQRWNGKGWATVASPEAAGSHVESSFLAGVSCTTVNFCMAVGYATETDGLPEQALIEKWNGKTWTIANAADVYGVSNALNAVSCVNPRTCTAVGDTLNGSGIEQTLVEQWNGGWKIVGSRNTSSSEDNTLLGVSCVSAAFCMAVGDDDNSGGDRATLIETWTGRAWLVTPSPEPARQSSPTLDSLSSVGCTSGEFCVAVGGYRDTSKAQQNLSDEWNGSTWRTVATPDTGTSLQNGLSAGVSCASALLCMDATSSTSVTGLDRTMTLRWSGSSWVVVPSPDTGNSEGNQLQAVSCSTPSYCFAVGRYQADISRKLVTQNLAERWQ